eukprot:TRINITY_DN3500_c0_g1_i1.p1 TRINITY_DN3500_c0_g1~~TRINITY_DN3500_c0_g1_i1.p1  ORF type:complete len:584 (+),score=109.85 TRINITY_DN3500_c0_g1_i1:334-2085(+)
MGDAALSVAKMSQGGAKFGSAPTNFATVSAKFAETFRSSQGPAQQIDALGGSAKDAIASCRPTQVRPTQVVSMCADQENELKEEFRNASAARHTQNSQETCAGASCPNCGNTLLTDSVFCRKCGERSPQALKKTVYSASPLTGQAQALDNFRKELQKGKSFKNTLSKREDDAFEHKSGNCCKCVQDRAASMVQTNWFEGASVTLIFINAFMIGAEINWELENPSLPLDSTFKVTNIIFVVAFTLELCLRIIAKGLSFCDPRADSFYWHMFDSILVFVSLIEEAIAGMGADINMSVLRLFRTLRLMRSFRIIRVVQAFRDLRLMMRGIMNSLKPLMWAGGLLLSIMYLVAICLLQFVSEEIKEKTVDASAGTLDEKTYSDLKDQFGSVFRAIFTLYLCITGGLDWGDAATPIMALNPGLGILFLTYIAFAVLCVLNIITGVFVENATRMSAQDDEMVLMEQMEARKTWMREVQDLFNLADSNNSGKITADDFNAQVQDVRLQAWFQKLGIQLEAYSANGLFELLDFDGDGELDIDEFLTSVQSVHGTARSIDVARIQNDVRKMSSDLSDLKHFFVLQPEEERTL